MRRAPNCFCGEDLEGDDQEEPLNWANACTQRQHSEMQLTDEQVRKMV